MKLSKINPKIKYILTFDLWWFYDIWSLINLKPENTARLDLLYIDLIELDVDKNL